MRAKTDLCSLPVELQTMALSWLPPRQIYLCRRINRYFCALIDDSNHHRPLYTASIARKQHSLLATVNRYCFFPTSFLDPSTGAETAFFRAGVEYIRFHGLTLIDAITHSEMLNSFVRYYCQRYSAELQRQRELKYQELKHPKDGYLNPVVAPLDSVKGVAWLVGLFKWYLACRSPRLSPLSSSSSSSSSSSYPSSSTVLQHDEDFCTKCLLGKTALLGVQAGFLSGGGGGEKAQGRLLRWLESTPGLVDAVDGDMGREKKLALGRRRRRVLRYFEAVSADANAGDGVGGAGAASDAGDTAPPYLLSREDGEKFLEEVGLRMLPDYAPLHYLVTTKGRGGEWVLDKVRRVGRKEVKREGEDGKEVKKEGEGKETGEGKEEDREGIDVFELALVLETVHLG